MLSIMNVIQGFTGNLYWSLKRVNWYDVIPGQWVEGPITCNSRAVGQVRKLTQRRFNWHGAFVLEQTEAAMLCDIFNVTQNV